MNRLLRAALCLCTALLLGSCGGGGDGGGSTTAPPSNVRLTSGAINHSHVFATTTTIQVVVAVTDLSVYAGATTIFVRILDPERILTGVVTITQTGANTFPATLRTSPALPPGTYKNTFEVQLCRDINCTNPFPNSAFSVPYEVTVTPESVPAMQLLPSAFGYTGPPSSNIVGQFLLLPGAPLPSDPSPNGPTVYPQVTDPDQVLVGSAALTRVNGFYQVTLTLSTGALAVGQHREGSILISLCPDVACAQPHPGGSALLTYSLTVDQP